MKSRLFLWSLLPALWLGGPCRAQNSDELFTPPTLFGDAKYIGPRTDFRMTVGGKPHEQQVRQYRYLKILRPKVENGIVSLNCSAREAAAQGMPAEFYRYAKKFCRMTNRLSRTFRKADWTVTQDCEDAALSEHGQLWLSSYWLYGSGDSLRFSLSPEQAEECYGVTPELYRSTAKNMRMAYDLLLKSYEEYPNAIRGSDPTPQSIFIQISPHFPIQPTAAGQAKERKKRYRKKMHRAYDTFLAKYDKLNADYDPRYFERPHTYRNDVSFEGIRLTMPLQPGQTRLTIADDGTHISIEKKKHPDGK